MEQSLEGRVAVVTGATNGAGKHVAIGLAAGGATVVGVGGNRDRAAVVKQEIRRISDSGKVEMLAMAPSMLGDVHGLVEEFSRRYGRLHLLVNTPGGLFGTHGLTVDGVERTFAVNYLSTFLLTNLLVENLRASAPARIINVCGSAHRHGHVNFDDLHGVRAYRASKAYAQAQLAIVVFTYELASRLDGSGVTVNCVEPGWPDLLLDAPRAVRVANGLRRRLTGFPRRAARGVIRMAADPAFEHISAECCNRFGVEVRSSEESYDPAVASRLWKISEELTGLVVR